MHKNRPKICTHYGVSTAKIYLYHSSKNRPLSGLSSEYNSNQSILVVHDLCTRSKKCRVLQQDWEFRRLGSFLLFLTIYYYVFLNFRCDSVDKLRNKLSSVEHEIQDANKFKEFYQFTFNYGKANTPGQKGKKLLKKKMIYLNLLKLFFL